MQIARLAVADKERVEGARAAAAHAYYSQFTFEPAINPKSKQLVRVSLTEAPDCVHSVMSLRTHRQVFLRDQPCRPACSSTDTSLAR